MTIMNKNKKDKDKEKYKYMFSGSLIAFILLLFLPIEGFNIFFVPLYKIIPIDSIVLIFFLIAGAILGYIYHKLK